jgi:signal transduction histidine kinase
MWLRLFNQRSLSTAMPFYLAVSLLVVTLLISFTSGYALYSSFRETKIEDVGKRLTVLTEISEPEIAGYSEYTMRSMLEDTFAEHPPQTDEQWAKFFRDIGGQDRQNFLELAKKLASLAGSIPSSTVALISPQKRVIADSQGAYTAGAPADVPEVDDEAWVSALMVGQAKSVLRGTADRPRVRVYAPVRLLRPADRAGDVGAVLRIEADFEDSSQITGIRERGILLAGVVAALTATVALLFYRLMRTFVRINERAAHSDRLQAMGTLTAGIAHEIRNPLGIIRALAEGLRGDFEASDPRSEMLDDITSEVERLNRLVNQYLQFARPDAMGPGELAYPPDTIRSLVPLLTKDSLDAPPILVEVADRVPSVRINSTALKQVLLNVLINAREATAGGQPILVRCAPLRGGGSVEIVVTDRGSGIAPRELRRAFDPFYTTRAHGTGLGLAICRQLVQECGGTIGLESEVGRGTTVRIVLPAERKAPTPSQPSGAPASPPAPRA